jgi:heme a synthase
VQISLGISNVVFHLPLQVAVAHNLGGAALLMTLVLVNYRVRSSVRLVSPAAEAQADLAMLPSK